MFDIMFSPVKGFYVLTLMQFKKKARGLGFGSTTTFYVNINTEEDIQMGQVVHQSQITITREKGPTRKAEIKGFGEPVFYGVHGGIKKFYRVEPEEEHAATLDHIVGAVGG